MASTTVATKFTTDTSGLTAGVKRATTTLDSFQKTMAKVQSTASLTNTLLTFNALGSAAQTLTNATKTMANFGDTSSTTIDRMAKLAASSGTTYASLKTLEYAATLSGASFETLQVGLTKSLDVLGRAQAGSAEATKAFTGIGLSVDELSGLDAAARFGKIADAINALPDPAARTAAAIKIFGESGAKLLPTFAGGSKAINEASQELSRFGALLNQDQVTGVQKMNDGWTRVRAAVGGIVAQVTSNLAPAVENVVNLFSGFIAQAGGANLGKSISDGILVGARYLADATDAIVAGFMSVWQEGSALFDSMSVIAEIFSRIASGISAAIGGFQGMLSGFVATILKAAEQVVWAAKKVAELIGADGFAKSLEKTQQQLKASAAASFDVAGKQLTQAGEDAKRVLLGGGKDVGEAIGGPVRAALEKGIQASQKALEAGTGVGAAAAQQIKQIAQETGQKAAEEIQKAWDRTVNLPSAIDARSQQGVNFWNAQMENKMEADALKLAREQLKVQKEMAAALQGGPALEVLDF